MTDTPAQHRKNQSKFEKKPSEVKKRVLRNKARAMLIKEGKVHKHDGKDVDHIHGTQGGNKPSNLRVLSQHNNRSYKRTSQGKQIRK